LKRWIFPLSDEGRLDLDPPERGVNGQPADFEYVRFG
jgi:hypothetical protein